MLKLCPIFSLPLYFVTTGLRTIQFLFDLKNGYQDLKSQIAIQLESMSQIWLGTKMRAVYN
jgi:hypothetical protein